MTFPVHKNIVVIVLRLIVAVAFLYLVVSYAML